MLPSPDDIEYLLTRPFIVSYWPLIVGGLLIFALAVRGKTWMMLPVGALFILLQLWHMGVFATDAA